MTIDLKPIDTNSWFVACDLEVDASQRDFVSPNAVSLAQAHYEPWWIPLGIYDSNAMVGFVMHSCWPNAPVNPIHGEMTPGNDHILRLMIDKRLQGKGYGRAAMIALIERIKAQGDCRAIELSFHPDNAVAEKLYASFGFVRTRRVIEGEIEMKLDVTNQNPKGLVTSRSG